MDESDSAELVARQIDARLRLRRESQGHLAKVLGLPRESVNKRMRGVTSWRLSELDKVAGHLGTSTRQLLDPELNWDLRKTG